MKTRNDRVLDPFSLFLNHQSWEGWVERYGARGFNVIAVPWPGLGRQRRRTAAAIRPCRSPELQHRKSCSPISMPSSRHSTEPPAIIIKAGVSFGGLFAQLLAYRGRGCAVVGVRLQPPRRSVLDLPFSTLESEVRSVLGNHIQHRTGHDANGRAVSLRRSPNTALIQASSRATVQRFAIPCADDRVLFEAAAFDNFVPHFAGAGQT